MIKVILAAQAVILSGLLLVAADLYAHKRVEMVGGVNIWGYRGAVAKRRAPGDARVLFVGGTRAYGYGADADGTIAHALEWELTVQRQRPTTVINAARMGATASDYSAVVTRHAYLDPDVIVLYDDLGYAATRPRVSKIAGTFGGYEPILPLVLEEKGKFVGSAALRVVGHGLRSVESYEAPVAHGEYAALMMAAADLAPQQSVVLIVVDPPGTDSQRRNLSALRDAVLSRAEARVTLLALPDVATASDLLDGYSYGAAARGRVMRAVLPELLVVLQ